MANFDIHLPCDVRFGAGRVRELGEVVAAFGGPSVLLVTGSRALAGGRLEEILAILAKGTKKVVPYRMGKGSGVQGPGSGAASGGPGTASDAGVAGRLPALHGEPAPEDVDEGAALARVEGCRLVVGIGGGGVIDAAKAIAAMAPRSEPVEAYIEGVGGRTLDRPGLPCVAVPTTAGTGAEVTRNSVLASRAKRYKRSVRSLHLVPRVAIVDPELAFSCPPSVTAASGMDAIVQLIEPYVSRNAQPFTDALAAQALPGAAEALERACADGRDAEARAALAWAALASGVCLSHAGLGVVHGLASPVGAFTAVPHGVACARMAAAAVRANAEALAEACRDVGASGSEGPSTPVVRSADDNPPSLRVTSAVGHTDRGSERQESDDALMRTGEWTGDRSDEERRAWESLVRLGQVGRWLTGTSQGNPLSDARAGADRLAALAESLRVPRFRDYGVTEADVEAIAANPGGNLKTNPVVLAPEALRAIVRDAL